MSNGKQDRAGDPIGFIGANLSEEELKKMFGSEEPAESYVIGLDGRSAAGALIGALLGAALGGARRKTVREYVKLSLKADSVKQVLHLQTRGCSCPNRDHDNAIAAIVFDPDTLAKIDADMDRELGEELKEAGIDPVAREELTGPPVGVTFFDYGNQEVEHFVLGSQEGRQFAQLLIEACDIADADAAEAKRAKAAAEEAVAL